MLVTKGKLVHVENGDFKFTRSAETPGKISLQGIGTTWRGEISLPGNATDAARFIAAYQRIVDEEVEYRKQEFE